MNPRRLLLLSAGLALCSALSIAFLDVSVARAVAGLPEAVRGLFRTGTAWLDLLSGKELSDAALGLALLVLAAVLGMRPARRALAARIAVVALTNLLAQLAVGLLKTEFGRLRPFESAASDGLDRFFAGGRSLPSGHTAYYWGLALPCALLFPRWRHAVLAPATFVAAGRVLVNEHFLGDVLGALALTAALTAGLLTLRARCGLGHDGAGTPPERSE